MWKRMNVWWLCSVIILADCILCESGKCTRNLDCIGGSCNGGHFCVCTKNWWGDLCQFCRERRGESDGEIVEGKAEYSLPTKCAWLVETDEPRNNRSVILNINAFSGPCGKRKLIVYDGSSVRSPVLAIVSDVLTAGTSTKTEPILQLRASSGSAFIVLTGKKEKSKDGDCWFNITYSFEKECSISCSSHGLCTEQSGQACECDAGWTSSNCSTPTCHVVCDDNSCDADTRQCNCTNGYTGESCNITDKRSFWSSAVANNQDILDGVSSHAMVVIGSYLWMFGGLSLSKGPLDTLARYSIKENMWEIIQASSEKHQGPTARYGHSLVAFDNSLILFGGTCKSGIVTNETWTFNTTSRQWTLLKNPVDKPVGVTGHTATVVGNEMIVLFGYSPEQGLTNLIQVFGLDKKLWRTVQKAPGNIRPTFGHSSVLHAERIYVHGGYRMLNSTCFKSSSDTFYYHHKSKGWHFQQSSSVPRFLHSAVIVGSTMVVFGGRSDCEMMSQHLMVFDIENNSWKIPGRDPVVPKTALRYGHSAVAANSIMYAFGGFQGQMFNTFLQYTLGDCMLSRSSLDCFEPDSHPDAQTALLSSNDICTAHNPRVDFCHRRRTCQDCLRENSVEDTEDSCMWCESHSQCVSKAAYDITFPYLQCMQLLERGTGTCSGLQCREMKSCRDCHTLPGCGWCDDGSGTGLGKCMQGGKDGPFSTGSGNYTDTCSKPNWNFIGCPACQCNGHSKCVKENSCGECKDNTTGPHCERCAKGYYGDARNGGKCEACQCPAHAKLCDSNTGDCLCQTRGVTGRYCDECEVTYTSGARDGICYYLFLASSSAQEFNLTGFKSFYFQYFPEMEKRSVQIDIKWTEDSLVSKALFNLTTFFDDNHKKGEKVKFIRESIPFQAVFPYHEYEFGHEDDFGFRGYVFGIDSGSNSAILSITITQQPETIDLIEFFLTFFGCFLSLLVVAGIVWKVRSRYINFILNRQRREERQKMASRPFSQTSILLHTHDKSHPGPVAVETCENNKAAVFTVLMRLPGTEDGFTPIDQSGLCFASVLATHGEHGGSTPAGKATRIRTTKRCASTCV